MRSLEEVGIDVSSGKMDIDIIMTGKPKSTRDKLATIVKLIVDLEKETGQVEEIYLLDELEKTYSIPKETSRALISQLLREGTIFQPREGYLKKT
jgi:replicative DNA helicase Mcm